MPSRSSDRLPWSQVMGPDVELPERALDSSGGAGGDSRVSPAKALMLAVLKDAIRCFQEDLGCARARARQLARQAERWIRSHDWNAPFSFNSVCEALGIDPDCMRKALLRTKYERLVEEQRTQRRTRRPEQPLRPAPITRLKSARR